MNESRNTNAQLFITVLCACLGLLTIGVPVQVKAQLVEDTKCSNEAPAEIEHLLNQKAFVNPLAEFVADIGKLISIDKYDLKERVFLEVNIKATPGGVNITGGSSGNSWLYVSAQKAAEEISYDYGYGDTELYRYDDELKQLVARFDVSFLLEDSSLVVKAKAKQSSPEQADKQAALYNSYFSLGSCRERGQPEGILYQNTRALVENNQVLVVTRLPRAALSVMLAKPLAAN